MKEFTEGAFAKVNLTLDVLDKREDGYHNLRSIMQTVSLHDDVHVTVGCEGWQVHCYREILPPDAAETTEPELVTCGLPQDRDNLVWKAAEAFYARTGKTPEGLEIFINKRIPLEAGLGGGSADAAAVLRALNRAYDSPLSIPALCELGAQVGLRCAVLRHGWHCTGRRAGRTSDKTFARTGVFPCGLQAGFLRFHAGVISGT